MCCWTFRAKIDFFLAFTFHNSIFPLEINVRFQPYVTLLFCISGTFQSKTKGISDVQPFTILQSGNLQDGKV